MSDFCENALTDKVSSLMVELSSECVECVNHRENLVEMTAQVKPTKKSFRNSLPNVFTEIHKTYEIMVKPVNKKSRRISSTNGIRWGPAFRESQSV